MIVEEQRRSNVGGVTGRGFMPGQSGNPGGRLKGSVSLTAAIRRMLAEPGRLDEAAGILWREFQAGNPAIVKEVWNRLEGKVAEPINLTVNGVLIDDLSDEEVMQVATEFGVSHSRY